MNALLVRVATLVALSACASTEPVPSPATLSPLLTTYVAGATVSAVLTNRSSHDISHVDCYAALEQRVGSRWVMVIPPVDPLMCEGDVHVVTSGTDGTVEFPLPATLEPGTYRLRQEIHFLGVVRPNLVVYSREFSVTAS